METRKIPAQPAIPQEWSPAEAIFRVAGGVKESARK